MPLSAIPSDPFRDEKAANKGRRDKYKFKMTRTIPDNNSLSEDNAWGSVLVFSKMYWTQTPIDPQKTDASEASKTP